MLAMVVVIMVVLGLLLVLLSVSVLMLMLILMMVLVFMMVWCGAVWCSDGDIHNVDYDIPRTCWSCLNPRTLKAFMVNGALSQWMDGEHVLRFRNRSLPPESSPTFCYRRPNTPPFAKRKPTPDARPQPSNDSPALCKQPATFHQSLILPPSSPSLPPYSLTHSLTHSLFVTHS